MRAALFAAHILDIGANAIARAEHFARDQIIAPHNRFRASQIEHHIAIFDALDEAVNHLADAVFEFFILLFALGFADALHNHLLGRLRGDTAKFDRRQFVNNLVTDLRFRIIALGDRQRHFQIVIFDHFDNGDDAQEFGLAGLRVDIDTNVVFLTITGFCRLLDGVGHGRENNLDLNALFARHRIGDLQELQLICTNTSCHFSLLKMKARMNPRGFRQSYFPFAARKDCAKAASSTIRRASETFAKSNPNTCGVS